MFRVLSNKELVDGTVPSNKELVDGIVLSNNELVLVDGTVPSNSIILKYKRKLMGSLLVVSRIYQLVS